jgi:hypothetical protein
MALVSLAPTLSIPWHYQPLAAFGADDQKEKLVRIDGVYFFGYDGFDLDKIRSKFPLKAGDRVDVENWGQDRQKYYDAVGELSGKPATDVALVSFDKGHILYVGIPGKSNCPPSDFLPVGKKRVPVSKGLADTYDKLMEQSALVVSTQSQEARQAYVATRNELVRQAKEERPLLLSALSQSADSHDRMVAAYALGLIASNKDELSVLAQAARDSNSVVRNNATRELGELLFSHPELAAEIPASHYIEMLNSPVWTDRNKSVFILQGLTRSRQAAVLSEMREKALPSLKEMCSWPSGYSEVAIELLGRIAGIPDDKLKLLTDRNDSTEVLKALQNQKM